MAGLLEVKMGATLKCIDTILVTEWEEPYSHTCGYVKNRVVITLVRETHRCIRGERVLTSQISVKLPQWGNIAGLNLFR